MNARSPGKEPAKSKPRRREDAKFFGCWNNFVFATLTVLSFGLLDTYAGEQPRTLESFGIHTQNGLPIPPYPTNVTLNLFDPDPLLDLAIYADGKIQLWRNLGNGTFGTEPIWERSADNVVRLEIRKSRMWSDNIPDINSWGDLIITFAEGATEKISHDQIARGRRSFGSHSYMSGAAPPLNFRETWRSEPNAGPSTYIAVDDIDNDGRMEFAYCFFPPVGYPDTNRIVVYECVGNDSFVVEWDTVMAHIFGPLAATDIDRNGKREWVFVNNGLVFFESQGDRQYKYYTSNFHFIRGYVTRGFETDVDHDGRREVCVQQADPDPPAGSWSTWFFISEFNWKTATSFVLSNQTIGYLPFAVDMAVGQVDGTGRDEIVPAAGAYGISEPVPIEYLWVEASSIRVREIHTGLKSGAAAPMFVNLDADTLKELFIGGVGPVGHGSCFALDYVSDTTWRVAWADSSLRNSPLSVDSGMLAQQFVVAGANTWHPRPEHYSQLHVYRPSGVKIGVWQKDTTSVQNFHFGDVDRDGRTDITAISLFSRGAAAVVYEYHGETGVSEKDTKEQAGFHLSSSYPNPFNPNTTLDFRLFEESFVSAILCDLSGKEVVKLLHSTLSTGKHTLRWDGRNKEGRLLSSGTYFLYLNVIAKNGSTTSATRKLLLLR
ncbi:MAG: T9SS type A sorting domain-containing protein [Ignavibacteriae bacterium]|nr:T9SS type A sorting domain-containing protein [Ignavibacteriota bacterium]